MLHGRQGIGGGQRDAKRHSAVEEIDTASRRFLKGLTGATTLYINVK